jgi:uncharacterized protein (DUF1330 family)
MAAYIVTTFRITDPERFQQYPPVAIQTIADHGGELLAADFETEAVEGQPQPVTAVLRFDSKEAARRWYESAEYQAIRPLRAESAEGTVMRLVDGFVMPQ